jgi:lysozyme family protein
MRYSQMWPLYRGWWDEMEILPKRLDELTTEAKMILASKTRYAGIEALTRVPWYMVGVIHLREANLNFTAYLGNGQPLQHRTTEVPIGRGPFDTWEAGALDALHVDGLINVPDWRLEKILFRLEGFNGYGYSSMHPPRPSPYVWGATSVQVRGKYVADHRFDPNVWDTQPGCAPVLKIIAQLDPSVQFVRET